MKRTRTTIDKWAYPKALFPFFEGATVYDSSCSPEARVLFLDKDEGYYLKIAHSESLAAENGMTRYFHGKGLSAEVLCYLTEDEKDYFITRRVRGEDGTHATYLADPKRLCDKMAESLRALHECDHHGCPVMDRTADYLKMVEENYKAGKGDPSFLSAYGCFTADEAYAEVKKNAPYLKNDVLLHGDYCLPNIMLDNWRLSAFIDVGNGGVGDRHIDLFWGVWTLWYNLKTDKYTSRFLDAYGRDKITLPLLRTVAMAEIFG